jgi:hypothetical protein
MSQYIDFDFESMPRDQQLLMRGETEIAIAYIHKALKDKGFAYAREIRRSALYHRQYVRGDRSIEISGWHGSGKRGTGRWFGSLKTLLAVYDSNQREPIIDSFPGMLHTTDLAVVIETHRTGIARAKAYVDALV